MTPFHPSNLEPPPEELCQIEGVAGVLLQQDDRVLICDLPLPEGRTLQLATLIQAMCRGFRNARRILRQVVLGYPVGVLLVLSRDDTQLALLLLDDVNLDAASRKASDYLARRLKRPLRLPGPAED